MRYFVKYDANGDPVRAATSGGAGYQGMDEVDEATYNDAVAVLEDTTNAPRTRQEIADDLRAGNITTEDALLEFLDP